MCPLQFESGSAPLGLDIWPAMQPLVKAKVREPVAATMNAVTNMPEQTTILSVLRHIDVEALRAATRRETRSRQRHLPPVSVYRWWARRTETVTGAIVDAVNADLPGRLLIADPFAGGGVIALATLLRGHQTYAQDVNPWATRSLATTLRLPQPADLEGAGQRLHDCVADVLRRAYATSLVDGTPAEISHTIRVAKGRCPSCGRVLKLFPAATVSLVTRIDRGGTTGYVVCPQGHMSLTSATKRSTCGICGRFVNPQARYTSGRVARCSRCPWTGKICDARGGDGFDWEIVLVERVAAGCREISPPSEEELAIAENSRWSPARELPEILPGIETRVLLRHGMRSWNDLYPPRQRVIIESLLSAIQGATEGDESVAHALEAAIIGSTEMAGFVSRWDARYLKAYEAMANHRFNFTTLAAEPNVWGVPGSGRGTVSRRLKHLARAASWLQERIGRPLAVAGVSSATDRQTPISPMTDACIVAGSSQRLTVPTGALDAVITDPPYHDDVQYGELSDLFRAWACEITGPLSGDAIVRRLPGSADTEAYKCLLTGIFTEIHRALRQDGHFVLSYANRDPRAWMALFTALEASGFQAAGYTVVHSENEADGAKVGRRACILDLLIDLIPATELPVQHYEPATEPETDEEKFCRLVGAHALNIGNLGPEWSSSFIRELRASNFLHDRDELST